MKSSSVSRSVTVYSSIFDRFRDAWRECAQGRPFSTHNGRIPSLDGLRAISILLVLFSHCFGTVGFGFPASLDETGDVGLLGVRVFFVISGFLITTLLLKEIHKTGRISLSGFYLRRTLRIFPAFYAYLGVVLLLQSAGLIERVGNEVLRAALYTTFYNGETRWTGQMWSLAIEEQFYILWPSVLLFVGRSRALVYLASVVALVPVLRALLVFAPVTLKTNLEYTFPVVCDSIAWGCILAYAIPWMQRTCLPVLRSRAALLSVCLVMVQINRMPSHPVFFGAVGEVLLNCCIALIIARSVLVTEGAAYQVLNWRPLTIIGVGSYSLYLWQGLFINLQSTHVWSRFPINVLATAVCAYLSYRFIESPFLALKDRFHRPVRNETMMAKSVRVGAGS